MKAGKLTLAPRRRLVLRDTRTHESCARAPSPHRRRLPRRRRDGSRHRGHPRRNRAPAVGHCTRRRRGEPPQLRPHLALTAISLCASAPPAHAPAHQLAPEVAPCSSVRPASAPLGRAPRRPSACAPQLHAGGRGSAVPRAAISSRSAPQSGPPQSRATVLYQHHEVAPAREISPAGSSALSLAQNGEYWNEWIRFSSGGC